MFLALIVVFTVSVNSAPLHGWILVCQLLSISVLLRILTQLSEIAEPRILYNIGAALGTIYGIWNLDFFRIIYKPLCLYPNMTTLQVMSLDYMIAAYPLVLIIVMYVMIDLHSHGWKPVVFLWKPFRYCFSCFRDQLNIKTSLIDAFGTFFTMSYVKFLSTTVDLLATARVWLYNGQVSYRLYYDGTMELFRGKHNPYAFAALVFGLVCNVIPLILILLYSFRHTHRLLNCLPLSVQTALFPFMDNILGCYNDGTNGTRNCRYFGVVYHLALFFIMIAFVCIQTVYTLGVIAFICILIGMMVAVIRPYKSSVYNTVDIVLILSFGLSCGGCMAYFLSFDDPRPLNRLGAGIMAIPPLFIPLIYFVGLVGYVLWIRSLHCCANF